MKKIQYESGLAFHKTFVSPIKSHIPKWYKEQTELWVNNKKAFQGQTLKQCIPFLDAMTAGYCIELSGDLFVEQRDGHAYITWGTKTAPVSTRAPEQSRTLPIPVGFDETHFLWSPEGSLKLPKGYSAVFTHPLNRFDLPFVSLSGVIDDFVLGPGKFPFFIQKGFEGLIPAGTPILQIIPFKREEWKAEETKGLHQEGIINIDKSASLIANFYKKNIWKKKTYN